VRRTAIHEEVNHALRLGGKLRGLRRERMQVLAWSSRNDAARVRIAPHLHPLAPKSPQFPAKAKRVIHLFMNGGPSHVDTFDPKPELTKYHGKELPIHLNTERKTGAAFGSPFSFKPYGKSGIEVSEIFAKTAESIDDICVIRSMQADVPNTSPRSCS